MRQSERRRPGQFLVLPLLLSDDAVAVLWRKVHVGLVLLYAGLEEASEDGVHFEIESVAAAGWDDEGRVQPEDVTLSNSQGVFAVVAGLRYFKQFALLLMVLVIKLPQEEKPST